MNAIKDGANHHDRTWKNQRAKVFKGKKACEQGTGLGMYEETLSSLKKSMAAPLETTNPSSLNKFIDDKNKSQQWPQV